MSDSTVYITTCCSFVFWGLNHSPELNGICRNCGKAYGHKLARST
jgi:hypothetical protein